MVGKSKRIEQESSRHDIERLFLLAAKADQKLADRYVKIARKLASRGRISLRRYNRLHCRKCSCYFTSKTLRVRTRATPRRVIIYACLRCGNISRLRNDKIEK